MKRNKLASLILVGVMALSLAACGGGTETEGETPDAPLTGTIAIDGSSTVFPITEAIAEEFNGTYPEVRIPIGVSGTGGGFKKFSAGETDISNASRPIKDEEAQAKKKKGRV